MEPVPPTDSTNIAPGLPPAGDSTNIAPGPPPGSESANIAPGLPPVQPPSGRFIAQLFVVPGLIILVVVLVVMGLSYWNRARDPAYYLVQLDSDNSDVRWRGASDLAQILKRTEPATIR